MVAAVSICEELESLLDVDQLGARLDERLAPVFEKREILSALGALGGPRAEQLLAGYLIDPDPGLESLALTALEQARALSPEGAGYSRNSPCPCGSGAKWKHCCAGERTAWTRERRSIRADLNELWR